MLIVYLSVLGTLLLGETQGFLFKSKVCYGSLGCFSKHNGFDNALDELPDSPEDVKVALTLYTRKGGDKGQVLDYDRPETLTNSFFDPKEETKIIVHGYMSDAGHPFVINITKYFLLMDNFNVITVDWKAGAHKFYPKSVANTRLVGAIIAKVMETARDKMAAKMADVHLVGHSLGAHISGYVGSRIEGIGRITGLDPAGPLFEDTPPAVRLDPTDAIYVDNIHTDGLPVYHAGFGTMSAWGHIDFYPNGAGDQPGCPAPIKDGLLDVVKFKFNMLPDTVACGHERSHDYFVASLADSSCTFKSYPCSSYDQFKKGTCSSCGSGQCPDMGYYSYKAGRQGKFYLTTLSHYPFCHS